MNIVLIGYRGTGKSVVAELVAKRLEMSCVGMDDQIVERAGLPITEIVQKYGWTGFRDRETELALDLAKRQNLVIDTGGGVIERPENMQALCKDAVVFWLKASVATIVSRIQDDTERPSLTGEKSFMEEVKEVLSRRSTSYRDASQHEIDTDRLTPQAVAERIVDVCQPLVGNR